MAQLKDTNVNGSLTVSGNITSTKKPTNSSHLVNKEYVDGIGTIYSHEFGIISNNTTGAKKWNFFTSDSYNITLPKGNYLVIYTCNATAIGTGVITSRMNNGNEEIAPNLSTRISAYCNTEAISALNNSFVLTLSKDTTYSFRPQIWGNVSWSGQSAIINIVKLTA